jgi:SET domain-containing protein
MGVPVYEVFSVGGGLGLRAACDLPAGARVCRFEGPILRWEDVPADEIRHALLLEDGRWLVDRGVARLLNHSCEPNSRVDGENFVVTLRRVARGEEFTFAYNVVYDGEDPGEWDSRWSFKCTCGAKNCHGRVDGYVTQDGRAWKGR